MCLKIIVFVYGIILNCYKYCGKWGSWIIEIILKMSEKLVFV